METEGKATVLSPGTLRQESHPFSLPGLPFANTSGHLVITLYLQTFLTHSVFRNQLTLCMHAKSLQLCLPNLAVAERPRLWGQGLYHSTPLLKNLSLRGFPKQPSVRWKSKGPEGAWELQCLKQP